MKSLLLLCYRLLVLSVNAQDCQEECIIKQTSHYPVWKNIGLFY